MLAPFDEIGGTNNSFKININNLLKQVIKKQSIIYFQKKNMNLCNFGKVIIARATKDLATLDWWNNRNDERKENLSPILTSHLSEHQRHNNYESFMKDHPKMQIEFGTFRNKLKRLQKYLANKAQWKNNNKNGEQAQFMEHFSLKNWTKLDQYEKQQHCIENCVPCNTIHFNFSQLHNSISSVSTDIYLSCKQTTEHFIDIISPSSKSQEKGLKIIKSIVNIVQPIVEEKLNSKFDTTISNSITAAPISPRDQQRAIYQSATETRNKVQLTLTEGGNDVINLLSSGKSFKQYNRDRLASCYETKEQAKERTEKTLNLEKLGKKQKKHHGNFKNYTFEREQFIQHLKSIPPVSTINWTQLGRKFNLKRNAKVPNNAGQIMMAFAKTEGINVATFNEGKRVSQRDYLRKIRRAKKIVNIKNKRITVPTPRTITSMKHEIKEKIATGELYIGIKVAPKKVVKTKLSLNGELTETSSELYARKIPLHYIRKTLLEEQHQLGVLRYCTDDEYALLSKDQIIARFERLNEPIPGNHGDALKQLIKLERTRKLKLWHDHSDILNHSYVCFVVSQMYDEANFYTDSEYKDKFPDRKPICVQSVVETPKLYIFGQSGKY